MADRINITGETGTDPDTGESFEMKKAKVEEQPEQAEQQEPETQGQPQEAASSSEETSEEDGWEYEEEGEEEGEEKAEAEEESEWEYEEDQNAEALSLTSLAEMSGEFASNGELSAERYTQLEQAGVAREVVDAVIQGQAALAENQKMSAIMEADLTLSQYQELAKWAEANWSEDQVETYNRLVDGPDHGARQMAIKSLVSAANGGRGPAKRGGLEGRTVKSGAIPFRSSDDLVNAMADPRYRAREEPYFSEVKARLSAMQ